MFLELLEKDYYEKEQEQKVTISKIGYCELKLVKQILKQEKTELKAEVLGKFFRGSAVHEAIPSILFRYRTFLREKYGLIYQKSEMPVSINIEGHKLTGILDMLFKNREGEYIVFDWKVVNYIPQEPHQHYIDQLYMYAEGVGAKKVSLVYFDSETMKEKEFRLFVDRERIEELKQKYIRMMKHLEGGTEPNKPFKSFSESWECSYCQYKSECWTKQEIKDYWDKQNNVVAISEDIAKQYYEIATKYKELEKQKKELEENIKNLLQGAVGICDLFSVKYITPAAKEDYDLEAIKKEFDIEKFKIIKESKPYYKFTLK